jgi:hypothetical protein
MMGVVAELGEKGRTIDAIIIATVVSVTFGGYVMTCVICILKGKLWLGIGSIILVLFVAGKTISGHQDPIFALDAWSASCAFCLPASFALRTGMTK